MTTTLMRRLLVVHPDGMMKVFDEGLQELDRGQDLLTEMLELGWRLVRRSQAHPGASTMILLERDE